jgi:hypothetical protein
LGIYVLFETESLLLLLGITYVFDFFVFGFVEDLFFGRGIVVGFLGWVMVIIVIIVVIVVVVVVIVVIVVVIAVIVIVIVIVVVDGVADGIVDDGVVDDGLLMGLLLGLLMGLGYFCLGNWLLLGVRH